MADDKKIIFSMVGVSKAFQANKQVLKDIYLSFFYGAKIGIIGLNGSGKSTLMKIIAGLEKSYQGEVVFSPGYSVGYLAQEPHLDDEKTVKEVVMEGVQSIVDTLAEYEEINNKFGLPEYYEDSEKMDALFARQAELQDIIDATDAWNLDSKLERAMDALRCPPEDQPVKNLSGGERRRVALCRLLLQKPDILLLDEPTNHLDAESIDWLEQHLQQYEGTVIAVTHDRYFLDHVGSCSVQKKCKAPQLDMPAEIVAGQSDTLTLSDRKWWEVYTDTTLCRLIGRTLDRNRNMLSAEARIRQLEELYRVSKAARLPSLGGLAAADYETNDYYGEAHKGDAEFDVKATLSWEADLWGNLRWAKRKGAAEYLASVEAARAMQMTLVAEVATAYFELVALDHELGVVRRTVETREESVRQAKLRFEGGLTSETAYQQAKVELASASALIPDLELRIAQKENQISVLAGDYPSRVARSKMDK